jgi:hypothetical protein
MGRILPRPDSTSTRRNSATSRSCRGHRRSSLAGGGPRGRQRQLLLVLPHGARRPCRWRRGPRRGGCGDSSSFAAASRPSCREASRSRAVPRAPSTRSHEDLARPCACGRGSWDLVRCPVGDAIRRDTAAGCPWPASPQRFAAALIAAVAIRRASAMLCFTFRSASCEGNPRPRDRRPFARGQEGLALGTSA